jgi:phosphoribosylformylglycinamidine synthase
VPVVKPGEFFKIYKKMEIAARKELLASAHGIYRGGLGVHLAMVAMGGNLGMNIDLSLVPSGNKKLGNELDNDKILFSETPGRFIITISPEKKDEFEKIFDNIPHAFIGKVSDGKVLSIKGKDGEILINQSVENLKAAWKAPFGGLI